MLNVSSLGPENLQAKSLKAYESYAKLMMY